MRKHPLVEFIRYIILLAILVTTMNPVVIVCFLLFSTIVTKGKLWLLDLWIFVAVVVIDLFSSIDGVTFLAYHNYHIITYEALIYGILSGLRLVSIVQVSWLFSSNVRSDKLVVITSILTPPISLLISMTVRNVRRYSLKLKEIYYTQLSMEEVFNIIVKFTVGLLSLSILIDWALENGMETIASMENRYYDSGHRTYYQPVSIVSTDIIELIAYLLVVVGYFVTVPNIQIIPEVHIEHNYLNTLIVGVVIGYCLVEEYFEGKIRKDSI